GRPGSHVLVTVGGVSMRASGQDLDLDLEARAAAVAHERVDERRGAIRAGGKIRRVVKGEEQNLHAQHAAWPGPSGASDGNVTARPAPAPERRPPPRPTQRAAGDTLRSTPAPAFPSTAAAPRAARSHGSVDAPPRP